MTRSVPLLLLSMLLFGSCNTTRRTVRFGMLTDIHYAERDPLNDRYYAQAMEKLCAAIGFTKEMIESLLTKKEAIRCNGRIYSEEHRRKFDIKMIFSRWKRIRPMTAN